MKYKLLSSFFALLFYINGFTQNFEWANGIGGNVSDWGQSIAFDGQGNSYTIGLFNSTADFDPGIGIYNLSPLGGSDIFILKLNSNGNFVWAKSFGGSGTTFSNEDEGLSIDVDLSGNILSTGFFNGNVDFNPNAGIFNISSLGPRDMFIQKLDSNGNFIWAKSVGQVSANCTGNSLITDNLGNVIITGSFDGSITGMDFDPGIGVYNLVPTVGSDAFVLKLDANGNFNWVKQITGDPCFGNFIKLDASGNLYIGGKFNGISDFDPSPSIYNLNSNSASNDVFILKLDTGGNFIWAKQIGGNSEDNCSGIIIDILGNVFVTGLFSGVADFDPSNSVFNLTSIGSDDIFVEKINSSGAFEWAKQIGGNSFEQSTSILLDQINNIYIIGSFSGTVDFNPNAGIYILTSGGSGNQTDAFIEKLDVGGNFYSVIQMGGSSWGDGAFPYDIKIDNQNNLLIAGGFSGTIDFDPSTLTNSLSTGNNYLNIFITKLSQTPPTPSCLITVSNVVESNNYFHQPDTLWQGSTYQIPSTIKVCADGSKATRVRFVNNTGINSSNIRFWIASDTFGLNSASSGYFINYNVNNDTITAEYAHPQYLSAAYTPFKTDQIRIVDYTNSVNNIFTIPLQIYRAPLIMVHGLWADASTFTKMENYLFDANHDYIPVLTLKVDYKQTHASSFATNYNIVPNSINALLLRCRNQKYSAGKVDLIGHSMGGILGRQYIQSADYKYNVHKFITINTPHSGTQSADFLKNPSFSTNVSNVMWYYGYDDNEGAVSDLKTNSAAINSLQASGLSTHYSNIANHSICTTQPLYLKELGWVSLLMNQEALAAGFLSVDNFLSGLYQGETNDLVVPLSSQKGGLAASSLSFINNQPHAGSCENLSVESKVVSLLNDSLNSTSFTHSGFQPSPFPLPTIYLKPAQEDSSVLNQTTNNNITINSPVFGTNYLPGQQISIDVTSNSPINHLMIIEGNETIGTNFTDSSVANASISYTIPQNAYGRILICAVGSDGNTIIDYDTVSIHVNVPASVDSIVCSPNEIIVPVNSYASVAITGYFSDSISRSLDNVTEVQYIVSDTNIAKHAFVNAIIGKQVGSTMLSVSFQNDTFQIPVFVIPEDTSIHQPTYVDDKLQQWNNEDVNPLKIFPNPSINSEFTILFDSYPNDKVAIEVYNVLGQRVLVQQEKTTGNTFCKKLTLKDAAKGIYYIKVLTNKETLSGVVLCK